MANAGCAALLSPGTKSFPDMGTNRRDRDARMGDGIGHSIEMMDHAEVARVPHLDTRALQTIRKGAAFAQKRIEFGSVHNGRRQA